MDFLNMMSGIKVAAHLGGEVVVDPTNVDREVDGQERQEVIEFTQKYLQGVMANPTDHAVCMYTMTPDKHFIVTSIQQPTHRLCLRVDRDASFKFTSVLGEILADLTLEGRTELPVEFLKRQRSVSQHAWDLIQVPRDFPDNFSRHQTRPGT